MNYLDRSVTSLKGVGTARALQLAKLGINTVRDLIYFFPRAYEKRGNIYALSDVPTDVPCSAILTVATAVRSTRIKNRLTISKFKAFDDSGAVEIVFFNSPFVKDIFTVGTTFRFFGKFSFSKKQLQLVSPKYEPYLETVPLPDFVPVYHLTEGLSSKMLDKLVLSVIDEAVANIKDPLPEAIRLANNLPTLAYAIKNAHFPRDEASLSGAMSRLAFDEMLVFGLGVALQSHHKRKGGGIKFSPCSLEPLTKLLSYELTKDQKNVINDVYRDTVIGNGKGEVSPMARIVVGDVGSGKTVCASAAMYIAASSGYQSALMVPTEILARQHFADMKSLFSKLGITVELLLGSTTAKEKKRIYDSILCGETDIIIGTHALISDKVTFKSLGLVITDEQHRFGVAQRAILKDKGERAHLLVMSATPIPRTLALTMYGDLDISRIKEMPKGRIRVDTFAVDESYRERLNDFIKKQVALGGQCYIVCPAIEKEDADEGYYSPESISSPFSENDDIRCKYAVEYAENLQRELPELRIECLHGKMKSAEKDEKMAGFARGETDVLVSTTVIEIGINVPNASLMIVENAERFGLSQLHQLRGRVGRGTRKSYCVLVSDNKNDNARARLEIMRTVYDGYEIAERDLMLRGPGDFFSSNSSDNFRQSGGFSFKFAKLCDDSRLFESAFSTAKSIIEADPLLKLAEHADLRVSVNSIIDQNSSNIS